MNRLISFLTLLVLIFLVFSFSYASSVREVSFTHEDRERLRNVELRLERLETKVDEGLKAVNQRIDDLKGLLYVIIGAIIAQIVGVVGFVLWDRRTALSPAIRKNKELEEREEKIEKALKELAKEDPKVAAVLRNVGLL
jgi:hypothetical protein